MKYAKSFLLLLAAFAFAGLPVAAQIAHTDRSFVTKAAEGGMAEVQMAQLAQTKAQSQAVKDLANKLYNDHTKAGDELKAIASSQNITWPSGLNLKQQREYNKLMALSGADFDREYVNYQIKDHKEDLDEFQHEANHGTNPQVKAWASKTLATLREHLQMAENALK